MLQAMRSKAAGIVVKILFSILVLAFAFWGIGDYSFLRRSDPTAVQIGDVKIPASALEQQYRTQLDRLRQSFGQIDAETAKQFGLMDQVIQRTVNQTALDKAAKELGITIGDNVVRGRLFSDPQLQGANGQFDRAKFQQLLFQSNLTEAAFVALFRQDLTRGLITEALDTGVRAPDILVDRLYTYRNEKRAGEAVFVPAASFTDVGKPDDAQVKEIYDQNHERFTAPEYRTMSVVRVSDVELMPTITVTDQQVQDEYRSRLPQLGTPEHRDVEQLLFADEAAAKAAYERLKSGTKLADIAKELKQSPEQTNLGTITREDLGGDLADTVFALPADGVSAPTHSPFGWHIFHVTKIEPGKQPSLAEVKDEIVKDLKERMAGDAAYDTATKLEDAVSNGAKLEDAAAKIGMPVVKVASDAQGRGTDGKPVAVLDGATDPLSAAFDTAEGSTTQLVEGREGAWYMIRIDGIAPSALKPLAEVRDQVVEIWQNRKRDEAAKARADGILKSVQGGKTLAAAAAAFGLKVTPVPPVLRSAGFDPRAAVPPEINARLFSLKLNEAGVAPSRGGVNVVRLTQVVAAEPAKDAAGVDRLREQVQSQVGGDIVGEYIDALRRRYGVTIDKDVVDKLM